MNYSIQNTRIKEIKSIIYKFQFVINNKIIK